MSAALVLAAVSDWADDQVNVRHYSLIDGRPPRNVSEVLVFCSPAATDLGGRPVDAIVLIG